MRSRVCRRFSRSVRRAGAAELPSRAPGFAPSSRLRRLHGLDPFGGGDLLGDATRLGGENGIRPFRVRLTQRRGGEGLPGVGGGRERRSAAGRWRRRRFHFLERGGLLEAFAL